MHSILKKTPVLSLKACNSRKYCKFSSTALFIEHYGGLLLFVVSAIMIRGVFRALLKQLFAEPFVNYLSIKVPSYIFGMVLSTPLMTSRKTLLHPMTDFLIQSVCQVLFLRYCFFMNNGGIYGLNTTKTCKCIMRFSNWSNR